VSRVPTQWLGSNFLFQFSTAIVAVCGGFIGLNLKFEDLDQPWKVGETDLSSVYATADVVRWPFYYVSHEYGFPNGANFGTQVVPDDVPYMALGLLRWVTGSPILAVNTFVLLSFAFTALAMLWICSRLEIQRLVSFPLSLATAWAPYVFVRLLYGHVVLASIWTIPLFFYLTLSSHNNGLKHSHKQRIALGLLIGASSAYYGFFSFLIATFVLTGTILTSLYRKHRVLLTGTLKEFACIFTFVVPSLTHVILDRLRGDVTPIERGVGESLQFAGDLRNVFIPFGIPSMFSDTLTLRQQFEWSPVSALTVIGIILMLLMFSSGDYRISVIRTVLMVGILFFTAGGLGVIFADLIFPGYRAWSRLMPFIIIAAHLGLALLLKELDASSPRRKIIGTSFIGILLLAGLQVRDARKDISPLVSSTADAHDVGSYLDSIELLNDAQDANCGILQLPLMHTFEGGVVGRVKNGDQFWPGILSDGYQWSYGAIKGTSAGEYWFNLTTDKARSHHTSKICAWIMHTSTPSEQREFPGAFPQPSNTNLIGQTGPFIVYAETNTDTTTKP